MTLEALVWTAFGLGAGIMGTLTVLAVRAWRPHRLEMDERWQAVRKL